MFFENLNLFIVNLCILLLFLSLWGLCVERRTLITIMVSVEIFYLSQGLWFINSAALFDDFAGQFTALLILLQAAAESGLGFSILVSYYRFTGSIELNSVRVLKG